MIRLFATLLIVVAGSAGSITAQSDAPKLIDSFGRLPCGHMMAVLDGVLTQWLANPDTTLVVVYRGQRYRKTIKRESNGAEVQKLHLAHRDDGLNWAKGIPKYLLARLAEGDHEDKITTLRDKITLIDVGYDEEIRADIWLVPSGSSIPKTDVNLTAEQVKFGAKQPYPVPNYVGCYSMYN